MENKLLQQFINEFISKSDRLRKNDYTHISYTTDTINGVFRKYFGVEVKFNPEIIVNTFKSLGFRQVEDKNQKWGSRAELAKPQRTIWINVDTKDLRLLRLTLAKLPDNTNKSKREKVNKMIERLQAYKSD